jgi:hypothetical protein
VSAAAALTPPDRVQAWAERILHPAKERYVLDGETLAQIPALRRIEVIPTEVLIKDAVERYQAEQGGPPDAVFLHPLRLLAMSRYDFDWYYAGAQAIRLRTLAGLGIDTVYGARAHPTEPLTLN